MISSSLTKRNIKENDNKINTRNFIFKTYEGNIMKTGMSFIKWMSSRVSHIISTTSIGTGCVELTPKDFKRAGRIPKDTVCRLFLAFVRLLPLLYDRLSASLWKDERVASAFGMSRGFGTVRPPFRLTSDKRPEGSQRRFHESYWQGRKTERRDVVDERAPRTRICSIVLYQQPVCGVPHFLMLLSLPVYLALNIIPSFSISHSPWVLLRVKKFSTTVLEINYQLTFTVLVLKFFCDQIWNRFFLTRDQETYIFLVN